MEAESLRVDFETSFKAERPNSPTGRKRRRKTAMVMLSLEESRCDYLCACIRLILSDFQ